MTHIGVGERTGGSCESGNQRVSDQLSVIRGGGRWRTTDDRLAFTNRVDGGSGSGFLFMLGQCAPFGASINPTNGVFFWTPTCGQASRTNQITVWVADARNTNLMDAMTFAVVVGECVLPSLGTLVLQAGDSAKLPVNLISSVPLTNLSMTLESPVRRLTNLWLEPIVPEICAAALTPALSHPMGEGEFFDLSLGTCSNQFLIGTQQVAWLHFTAVSNQSSAFVELRLDDTVGRQTDGAEVRNFAAQSGRLVIIGEEPLLEAGFGPDLEPAVTLYGKPGPGYVIETATNLGGPWTAQTPRTLEGLWIQLTMPASAPQQFYRAKRE